MFDCDSFACGNSCWCHKKIIDILNTAKDIEYIKNYYDVFDKMCDELTNNYRLDSKKYYYCVQNVDKLQELLGDSGINEVYIDPLKNIQVENYQVMLQTYFIHI